ncbi:MAG: hypothetical protein KAT83_02255 [Candidatus Aenigmarchaeota archaeon]|nr:hypothetical protein [Candidatus Aenigmarchaeota archaeon]
MKPRIISGCLNYVMVLLVALFTISMTPKAVEAFGAPPHVQCSGSVNNAFVEYIGLARTTSEQGGTDNTPNEEPVVACGLDLTPAQSCITLSQHMDVVHGQVIDQGCDPCVFAIDVLVTCSAQQPEVCKIHDDEQGGLYIEVADKMVEDAVQGRGHVCPDQMTEDTVSEPPDPMFG